MTREEKQKAIDAVERLNALKQFIGYDKDSEIVQATQKSLDMAIKALEQEPCEDCISRKEVLELLEDTDNGWIINEVLQMPSVTSQKPKPDVLDKIRSEIKEVQTYKMFEGEDTVYVERKDVLAIINKYNAESEG